MPSGLLFFRASGSSASGKFWKHTGRRKRSMARAPTEVPRASDVAGYGPPMALMANAGPGHCDADRPVTERGEILRQGQRPSDPTNAIAWNSAGLIYVP